MAVLKPNKMTATQVLDILEEHYSQSVSVGRGRRPRRSPWAFLREVRMGTGKVRRRKSKGQPKLIKQRIDAWAYNTWPSQRSAIAFEVKTSRQDFLNELKRPEKRQAALGVSSQFYFVTTDRVACAEEIPEDCGWIHIHEGEMIVLKEAPERDLPEHLPPHFINSLIRRIGRIAVPRLMEETVE
jgi:hypothetical protein